MKHWKLIFPFITTKEIPHDIEERLSHCAFYPLKDALTKTSGFALLTESERFIKSDGRHLFQYTEQSRKADVATVNHIHKERLQAVTDEGREVTPETLEAIRAVAEREALKFARINTTSVYILYDFPAGRVWCAGSTVKKCETALKRLRKVIGSLDTEPVVLPLAARQLVKVLQQGRRWLNDSLAIPEYAKVVAEDRDGEAGVTFDGVCVLDRQVGEMLEGMLIRTTEMHLHQPAAMRDGKVLASFVLDAPEHAGVSLRALDYGSGKGEDDDGAEQNHAADMQIVAKTCEQIMAGLNAFTHHIGG